MAAIGTWRDSATTIRRRHVVGGPPAGLTPSSQRRRAHSHAFHSFAIELLRTEVPLTAVGALLGHESLQGTARYIQPAGRDLREAVQHPALEQER